MQEWGGSIFLDPSSEGGRVTSKWGEWKEDLQLLEQAITMEIASCLANEEEIESLSRISKSNGAQAKQVFPKILGRQLGLPPSLSRLWEDIQAYFFAEFWQFGKELMRDKASERLALLRVEAELDEADHRGLEDMDAETINGKQFVGDQSERQRKRKSKSAPTEGRLLRLPTQVIDKMEEIVRRNSSSVLTVC